jgi:hypothetical protein
MFAITTGMLDCAEKCSVLSTDPGLTKSLTAERDWVSTPKSVARRACADCRVAGSDVYYARSQTSTEDAGIDGARGALAP